MKNLFTILLTMFAVNVFAQNGNMIFFTEDNENFTLMVNSVTINTIPSNNVRVDNRPVTRYKVFVKFQNPELGSITDNVYIVAGTDKTFVIKPRLAADIQAERVKNMHNPKTKNNYVAKYAIRLFSSNPTTVTQQIPPDPGYNNGGVNTNGYNNGTTNPNTGVNMNTNPNGVNINTGTNDPLNPNLNINVNPNGMQINGGGVSINASGTGTGTQSSSYSTTTTTTTTTTTGNGVNGATWAGCAGPLNIVSFQAEERKVRNQTTEAGKIITAQQLSTNYCLTSAQIKTLCGDIFQERDRLTFAEYAYPRCYDPANFSVVYSAFYIDANVQELNRFVTTYGAGTGTTGYNTNPNSGSYNNNGGYNTNPNNSGYNNGGGYVPGYSGPYGCPMPMNSNDFNTAKESIRSKSFESTKLEIAKQITDANCFTAQQIKEVVQVFEFEATKLEYAKYAFPHCYDKNNYYKVNDAFTFEASMTELSAYVKGK